jgi:hypothetical protein
MPNAATSRRGNNCISSSTYFGILIFYELEHITCAPKVNSHNVWHTLIALAQSGTQKLVCIELFCICLGRQIKVFVIFPVIHHEESMFIWNSVAIASKFTCFTVIPIGLAIQI